jgi:large conductance mechanosensitive channel
MGFASEFKEFAVRGNVVDLAVGVVIGAAFGKIVSSFVADIVTPLLALDHRRPRLLEAASSCAPTPTRPRSWLLRYGMFLQSVFDFILIAFAIFIVIKLINKMRRQQAAAPAEPPPAPTTSELLLTEIRATCSPPARA